MELTKRQKEMVERAIRYAISDLQYERHQALAHGCSGGSYDKEIEEFRQLKEYFINEGTTETKHH